MNTTTAPQAPRNIAAANRCRAALQTFFNVKAAREFEARTGTHAARCPLGNHYHA